MQPVGGLITWEGDPLMNRLGLAILVCAAAIVGMASPAFADPASTHVPVSTTLDACGYFVGTQTPRATTEKNGVTTQHGTWTGVTNDYSFTPVASLGSVVGSFKEQTETLPDGTVVGTETFHSGAGTIVQSFEIGPNVPGFFSVSVTATRDLAFLTSSTNGDCYTGPFPRP